MQKQTCPCPECPHEGDVFTCAAGCGFEITVTADCACPDPECTALTCCGVAMKKEPPE